MTTTTPVDIGAMIVATPGTCGGKPRIAGHRISVRNIVIDHLHGESPDQILVHYPTLSLAHVHAALAYYYANREVMDAIFRSEDEEADTYYQEYLRARKSAS